MNSPLELKGIHLLGGIAAKPPRPEGGKALCSPAKSNRKRVPRIFAILSLLLFSAAAHAELPEAEIHDLFSQGKDLFREANDLTAKDPVKAKGLYRQAALRFVRIANEGGVQNGKLFYNIGNVYSRLGDHGRAILYYRKAGRFISNDMNLQRNLSQVRRQRLDKMEEAEEKQVLTTLFFWHYDISTKTRAGLFLVAHVLLWGLAIRQIWIKRPWMSWTMFISGIVAACLMGSLVVEARAMKSERPGVVIAEQVTARTGDSESYESAFKDPLHSGAEFTVKEIRQDWLHVTLQNGRECWLPQDAVGIVY